MEARRDNAAAKTKSARRHRLLFPGRHNGSLPAGCEPTGRANHAGRVALGIFRAITDDIAIAKLRIRRHLGR